MNGTVYSGPLQSDPDILNQLSSHTVHVLSCASSVMNLIAEIGESLKYACVLPFLLCRQCLRKGAISRKMLKAVMSL